MNKIEFTINIKIDDFFFFTVVYIVSLFIKYFISALNGDQKE